jgi:hypothetical protein
MPPSLNRRSANPSRYVANRTRNLKRALQEALTLPVRTSGRGCGSAQGHSLWQLRGTDVSAACDVLSIATKHDSSGDSSCFCALHGDFGYLSKEAISPHSSVFGDTEKPHGTDLRQIPVRRQWPGRSPCEDVRRAKREAGTGAEAVATCPSRAEA